MKTKYPQTIEDLSDEPYYAIITGDSVYIEGDERSRTNPGHGYPAHTRHSLAMEVYYDRDEWIAEIKRRQSTKTYYTEKFKAVKIEPAKITVTINIGIE